MKKITLFVLVLPILFVSDVASATLDIGQELKAQQQSAGYAAPAHGMMQVQEYGTDSQPTGQMMMAGKSFSPCMSSDLSGEINQIPCGNVLYSSGAIGHGSSLGVWFALMIVITIVLVWTALLLLIGVLWHMLKKHRRS